MQATMELEVKGCLQSSDSVALTAEAGFLPWIYACWGTSYSGIVSTSIKEWSKQFNGSLGDGLTKNSVPVFK